MTNGPSWVMIENVYYMATREYTLSQAARLLNEPQHRLIYLCEKGVVQPDFQDAEGRGSSRRFSVRNLLEFAVALMLRELTIPVGPVGAIVYVLRAFEREIGRQSPGFRLAEGLRKRGAPELRIIVSDGERLYFSLGSGNKKPKLYGGIHFKRLVMGKPRIGAAQLRKTSGRPGGLGGPEGSSHARIEVSVTAIAKDLPMED